MIDWTAPFHKPKLTDQEFAKMRNDYIAEHGYSITVPGLTDIFHLSLAEPMSEEEKRAWRRKEWGYFTDYRLNQLQEMKEKKRRRFEGMLGSPTPSVVSSAGSVLTAVDDAQDAISTLGMIGRLAIRVSGKKLGKALMGPVGVILTVSDCLDMVQALGMKCQAPIMGKREVQDHGKASPKKNKWRHKISKKLKKWHPTKGDLIQGLQTTDQMAGMGICLGPVMGFALDVFFGTVRSTTGKAPNLNLPIKALNYQDYVADSTVKSQAAAWGYEHHTDYQENLISLAAFQLAVQHLAPTQQDWNPLEQVQDLDDMMIQAPVPTNILTLEVIEEAGKRLEEVCAWPQTGSLWSPLMEVVDLADKVAQINLNAQVEANRHDWTGYVSGLIMNQAAGYSLGCLEGLEGVETDTFPSLKIAQKMVHFSTALSPTQEIEKFHLFSQFMQKCDDEDTNPEMREIREFCNGSAGIELYEY